MHEIGCAVFKKWELDFATVGKTTDDLRFRILWQGTEVANLPIKDLGDEAPEYNRLWQEPDTQVAFSNTLPEVETDKALLKLLASPNLSSRRWVWEQYDTLIQGNSLQIPGGDAGVVRVDGHPTKALAFSSDVTPRYCEADPYEGGKQAVAECWRNITATGAEPLASTDNLNFGNPEKPEIMGQLVKAIEGIGEACRVLEFPIVSGNVSLYNETNGVGILPTPTMAGVGLIPDWSRLARIGFSGEDETILLIGAPENWGTHLGQSIFIEEMHGLIAGRAPNVDLAAEKNNGDFVRTLVRCGTTTCVHDCSDGGLGIALAEMAMASGIGATIDDNKAPNTAEVFFGEDQGRYVLTVKSTDVADVLEKANAAGVTALTIGTTGGAELKLGAANAISVDALTQAHEDWFPTYMGTEI
jgi:phosphoribosylformylglycinamidine synthase